MAKKSEKSTFLAGLLGAITGAIGGLLLAPKKGADTRKDIQQKAKELQKTAEKKTTAAKRSFLKWGKEVERDAQKQLKPAKSTAKPAAKRPRPRPRKS